MRFAAPVRMSWLHRLLVNHVLLWLLVVPIVVLITLTTLQYHQIENTERSGMAPTGSLLVADRGLAHKRILNDYDDFYVVGQMYRQGNILSAYQNDRLLVAQQRFTGAHNFMPWAYPPQLTAMVPLLPVLGMGQGFALFIGGTLILFLFAIQRLAGPYAGAGLLAVYPAAILNARLGQNGFLTAALVGFFLLAFRARRQSGAGFPLGLMVIKPHLGVAMGLVALLDRRWRLLAVAMGVVAATSLLATLVLGVAVWPAFLGGVHEAGGFLRQGRYPLYRMSSVYAGVRSFGAGADLAFVVHFLVALCAIAVVALAYVRRWPVNRLLATVATAGIFISPYNYDYDLICLSLATALILPELLERMNVVELVCFYGFAWIGTGSGLAQHFRAVLIDGTTTHPHGSSLNWSFQAVGVACACLLAAFILRRSAPSAKPVPARAAMASDQSAATSFGRR